MEKHEVIWHDTYKQLYGYFREDLTAENLVCKYSVYQATRQKINYWETIRAIYQRLRKNLKGKYYDKALYIIYDYCTYPCNMIAQIRCDSTVLCQMVVWSMDNTEVEKSKKVFKNWRDIEDYYNYLSQRVIIIQENRRIAKEREQEQARKKEERRRLIEREAGNIPSRKLKARRHLKRLGYDLHISRKVVFNGGRKYQIVELDSGKIVAGQNYDLTLDEVEIFYRSKDSQKT